MQLPLPEASRPSKSTTSRSPLAWMCGLQLEELELQFDEAALVDLALELFGVGVAA